MDLYSSTVAAKHDSPMAGKLTFHKPDGGMTDSRHLAASPRAGDVLYQHEQSSFSK